MNTRAIAAKILTAVIRDHQSLTEALNLKLSLLKADDRDSALVKQYCYGTLRWYHRLKSIAQTLLHKPLKSHHQDIDTLLLVGLYQLIYLNTPHYAAVSETVAAANILKKPWAKGLINQCLNQFIRDSNRLLQQADSTLVGKFSHPQWMIERIQTDWPEQWQTILLANNQQAPMFLRVNQQQINREQYILQLQGKQINANAVTELPQALQLEQALSVEDLPGFKNGLCSVQDLASQYVVNLLDCQPGFRVLDACAAPGGKACHILETQPNLKLIALDQDPNRLKLIESNRQRLQLSSTALQLLAADASRPELWWDGQPFDRILLDAPCSATGVIRRHPDIKILRQPEDIGVYAQQQYALLAVLWPLLRAGGKLVYSTCSIFAEENEQVALRFYQNTPEAQPMPFSIDRAAPQKIGCQLLPDPQANDGFYYAVFIKN